MRKPFRITTWWGKLLYAVGAWCAAGLFNRAIRAVGGDSVVLAVLSGVLLVAIVVVGARLFRGADELRDPPRPRWQMTSRAKLSRRLGILFIALTVWAALGLLAWLLPLTSREFPHTPVAFANSSATGAVFLILAVLYVRSGRRLRRLEPTPKRERTDPALSAPFDDGWPRAR